jgi:hypothetical protein
MPAGAFEFLYIFGLTYVCAKFPNTRTYAILLSMVICLIGGGLVFALPYDNKAGLLIGYYIVSESKHVNQKEYSFLTMTTGRFTRTRLEICFS